MRGSQAYYVFAASFDFEGEKEATKIYTLADKRQETKPPRRGKRAYLDGLAT
jgi:hypothetical protein